MSDDHAAIGCGLGGEGQLVLDRGELPECALTSAAVVGVLDSEHDLLVQLVAGGVPVPQGPE